MKDRIPGAPGQFSATVDGTQLQKLQRGEPFTITLKRDDQPIVEGTPYSKAAVLPDALATRLCPGLDDPSPADAFSALADRGVISQGKKDGWFYRQWANGMAECWITIKNPAATPADLVLPFCFKGYPAELKIINSVTMLTSMAVSGNLYAVPVPYIDPETREPDLTKTAAINYQLTVYDLAENQYDPNTSGMSLNLYVVGEWKDIVSSGGSYPVWEGGLY